MATIEVPDVFAFVRATAADLFRSATLKDRCFLVSYAASVIAPDRGIHAEVIGGSYLDGKSWTGRPTFGDPKDIAAYKVDPPKPRPHAWNRWEGHIVDLTLTQFKPEAKLVSVFKKNPRYVAAETYDLTDRMYVDIVLHLCGAKRKFEELVKECRAARHPSAALKARTRGVKRAEQEKRAAAAPRCSCGRAWPVGADGKCRLCR